MRSVNEKKSKSTKRERKEGNRNVERRGLERRVSQGRKNGRKEG